MSRLSERRRYGIHIPQLVGRLSQPKGNETPQESLIRIPGEFDAAMQELQRYLKYARDAADDMVAAGAAYLEEPEIVDASAGDPGDPNDGWSPGPHRHQVRVGSPVGLGNANALGGGVSLALAEHVHK